MKMKRSLHIAFFPWLAFGHMIPFVELAKIMARKGHMVSFLCTPRNIERLLRMPGDFPSSFRFVRLESLPPVDGLPSGAEATMDVPDDQVYFLKKAVDGLKDEVERFLKNSELDWMVYDFFSHWLLPMAAERGISLAFFCVITPWFIATVGSPAMFLEGSDKRRTLEDFAAAPEWFPEGSKIHYHLHEVKRWGGDEGSEINGISDRTRSALSSSLSDVMLMRYSYELQPEWLTLVSKLYSKPLIPVGLLLPAASSILHDHEWLSKQEKGSVVFVALGSEVVVSQKDITELAHGLNLSGLPFLWVVRNPITSDDTKHLRLPEGFEKETSGRGIVCSSWAPQFQILNHPSVGGFLTHCGWGSLIEGMGAGLPLIMLPFVVDQGLNARVFGEWQMGIEVPRDEEDGSFTRHSVAQSLRLVMVEEGGRMYRDKATEMKATTGDTKRQEYYIDALEEFLTSHRKGTLP